MRRALQLASPSRPRPHCHSTGRDPTDRCRYRAVLAAPGRGVARRARRAGGGLRWPRRRSAEERAPLARGGSGDPQVGARRERAADRQTPEGAAARPKRSERSTTFRTSFGAQRSSCCLRSKRALASLRRRRSRAAFRNYNCERRSGGARQVLGWRRMCWVGWSSSELADLVGGLLLDASTHLAMRRSGRDYVARHHSRARLQDELAASASAARGVAGRSVVGRESDTR